MNAKRTFVALLPVERAELERLATIDNRTHSALARIYLLRGMQTDPAFDPANLRTKQDVPPDGDSREMRRRAEDALRKDAKDGEPS